MYTKIKYLFILFIIVNTVACKNEEKAEVKKESKATVEISSNKDMNLKISKIINIGMLHIVDESITVTPDKKYKSTLKTDRPILCMMITDNNTVAFFMEPDKELHIQLTKDKDQLIVAFDEGDYMNKYLEEFHQNIMPLMRDQSDEKELLIKIDQKEAEMLLKLDKIKSKIDTVSYQVLYSMVKGKMAHIKFMQSERFPTLKPESSYYDFSNNFALDDDHFLVYSDNLNTIIGVLDNQYEKKYAKPLKGSEHMLEFINEKVKSDELKSEVISFLMTQTIPQMTNKEKEDLMVKLEKFKIKEQYLQYINSIEAETALGRKIGNPGKYLETLQAHNKDFSIDKLKNKTVYVDNWATWCGPCVKSIKQFNAKQKSMKQSDDIVYVFVSFDRKETIWKNYLKNNSFAAKNVIHLFNGSDMNSKYAAYYNVSELPFYMVIGKNGLVKDLKPKEPMDDDYKDYIEQLLNSTIR